MMQNLPGTYSIDEVTVPDHFAMYTSKGNARLAGYATTLLKQAKRISVRSSRDMNKAVRTAVVSFLAKWDMTGDHPNHGEARDTAVREAVGYFSDEILGAFGIDGLAEWEQNRLAAMLLADKRRETKRKKEDDTADKIIEDLKNFDWTRKTVS